MNMMYFIVGAVFFILGGMFGVGFMCLFKSSKQAEKEMQDWQEVKNHE